VEKEDARALLSSTQQLRTHWSGVLTSHFGLSLTINVAIWSYFVKSFVDSMISSAGKEKIFLYVASALSSLLLGLWRVYTRHIDDHIANLYPDFLLSEEMLQVPSDRGTCGYLRKAVPGLQRHLNGKLSVNAISCLVKLKRMGNRGHFKIDLIALGAIIVMSLTSIILLGFCWNINLLFLTGNALGLSLIVVAMTCFQKDPREEHLKACLKECRSNEISN
jgi:hypothetical protein